MIKIFKKNFKKHIDVSKTQVYTVNRLKAKAPYPFGCGAFFRSNDRVIKGQENERDHNSTNSKMNESEEFYYEIKGYGTYSTRVEGHGQ